MKDCIESKVFGIGLESYTVGSNDFYIGYGASRNKMVTLDTGHFHPTESVADKSILVAVALRARIDVARKPSGSLGFRPRNHYGRSYTLELGSVKLFVAVPFGTRTLSVSTISMLLSIVSGLTSSGSRAAQKCMTCVRCSNRLPSCANTRPNGQWLPTSGFARRRESACRGMLFGICFCLKNNVPVGEDYHRRNRNV